MRRRFLILALLVCSAFAFAEDYFEERTAKGMVLPDGDVADVLFFKKWGDANYYIGQKQPKDMKVMIGVKAKTEAEVGYLRKNYKASENESVAALCAIHEETGSVYSVAFVDHGERVTRCVFTYKKGGKLIYDRMDFFDESNGSYADYVARENAKREKITNAISDVITAIIPTPSASNETPEQVLYRRRHYNLSAYIAGRPGDTGTTLYYRNIYYDDGRQVYGYIVDLDGNIRSDIIPYPIVQRYSVPKEIRDLAQKSLD